LRCSIGDDRGRDHGIGETCGRGYEDASSDKDIFDFLQDKITIPRYIRPVEGYLRTEAFRVKTGELKSAGVTPDTYDAEKI
jgi:hypothetical protein